MFGAHRPRHERCWNLAQQAAIALVSCGLLVACHDGVDGAGPAGTSPDAVSIHWADAGPRTATDSSAPATDSLALQDMESAAPSPPTLGVAAVRVLVAQKAGDKWQAAVDGIDQVLVDHADVDVILTPEYSFTPTGNTTYADFALDFTCSAGFDDCSISATAGLFSADLAGTLEGLRARALKHAATLLLGTVIERFDASSVPGIVGDYVYFNDLLIVAPDGKLSIRRKTSGDWLSDCAVGSTVTSRDGRPVRLLPVICAERRHAPMLERMVAQGLSGLDLLISPEREGDIPYLALAEAIQDGSWSAALTGWDWGIRGLFIDEFVTGRGLIKGGAFLVVAEGASAGGGMIQLAEPPKPLTTFEVKPAYIYGVIPAPE
jgi:hypothetical protein